MDNLFLNFTCNTSKVYYNSLKEFFDGYNNAADLIVSTIFAEYGLYGIVKHTATEENIIKYSDVRLNLQGSYIWSDLYEISDMLRCSYLYRTTYKSLSYMLSFNDTTFGKTMKCFKYDFIEYIQNHSKFIAYCDLETSGLLLYTNPEQALQKDKFVNMYNNALYDINQLHHKYKGRLSKTILSTLHEIRIIINTREINNETLITPINDRMFARCIPSFDKNEFNDIILNFDKCDINHLHHYMEIIYTNLSLLHVISSVDWLVLMQGKANCINCHTLLQEYITLERLEYLRFIEDTIHSSDTSIMKQELTKLNFLKKALRLLRNKNMLKHYSLNLLGYNSSIIIANATRLYNNNIKLITYADLLFVGFYDIVDKQYLPSYKYINSIIVKAEKDLKDFSANNVIDNIGKRILMKTTYTFCQSLKKVKRFSRWLRSIQHDDLQHQKEIQEGIDLIFGNVFDKDGQPSVCPICLDSSVERNETWWKIHPCAHTIHIDCYNELSANEHCVCPMCREKIT